MPFVTGVRSAVEAHTNAAATECRTSIIVQVCITCTTGIAVSGVQPYATEMFRASQTFPCNLVNCTWPKHTVPGSKFFIEPVHAVLYKLDTLPALKRQSHERLLFA